MKCMREAASSMKNKRIVNIIALFLASAVALAVGFFAGKNVEANKYAQEKEYNVSLNKSELEAIGEIEGTIYITGHKSPDADTVGSSIGYAQLLQKLGYDARPLGSTATIVWLRYRDYGLEPEKETAIAMLGSIFSDTEALHSDTTTFADEEAVKALSEIGEISDLDAFWQDMQEAALSYEGMTDEEIFFNDYKEYESGGIHYGIDFFKAPGKESADDYASRMIEAMASAKASTGMDMEFAQIRFDEDGVSYTYLIPSDDVAKEVLQAAFGDTATYNGVAFVITPSVSRKATVVPALTEVLKDFPHE